MSTPKFKVGDHVEFVAHGGPHAGIHEGDIIEMSPSNSGSDNCRVRVKGEHGWLLISERFLTLVTASDNTTTDSPCLRAYELVHGDRQNRYGHPLDDFTRTATIWTAILGTPITAEQVALCMVGVKISREINQPGDDNRVDAAGYIETLNMVINERRRRVL